jgi:hypothetical protein
MDCECGEPICDCGECHDCDGTGTCEECGECFSWCDCENES